MPAAAGNRSFGFDSVRAEYAGTVRCLFIDFLQDSGRTLFVQGKAGCGKSTFMKYVAHHDLMNSGLKLWARSKKLVTIKVFFWRSDDLLQESIEGFLGDNLVHSSYRQTSIALVPFRIIKQ